MSEEWRPVAGFEGLYEVSNLGRVKSLHHNQQRIMGIGAGTGRSMVHLFRDGKGTPTRVAVLVAEAFIGPRPDGHVVDHIDEDSRNDRADNLQWVTQAFNVRKSARHRFPRRSPPTIEEARAFKEGCRKWRDRDAEGISALLREVCKARQISEESLARLLGLTVFMTTRILNQARDPGPVDRSKIGVGLGLSPAQLAVEAEAARRRVEFRPPRLDDGEPSAAEGEDQPHASKIEATKED